MGSFLSKEAKAAKLLNVPEAVQLWLDGRQERSNYQLECRQARAALPWLLAALKLSYISPDLKMKLRNFLMVEGFTGNLEYFYAQGAGSAKGTSSVFTSLQTDVDAHLRKLGVKLKCYYRYYRLGEIFSQSNFDAVTTYHPLFRELRNRENVSQAAVMPEVASLFNYKAYETNWKMYEERYLHCVAMIALAVDEGFQSKIEKLAKRFGMNRNDKTFQPAPPKSFVRANNKKTADYRYYPRPRTGFNIDMVRTMCVCSMSWTIQFFKALVAEFGGAVKVKCMYSLPAKDRRLRFHLLNIMLTVVYEPKRMTYAKLFNTATAKWLLDDYCAKPNGIPAERWAEHTSEARHLLTTGKVGAAPVRILGEIQIILPRYSEIRHQMHELYKVSRAYNCRELYNDFASSTMLAPVTKAAGNLYTACFHGQMSVVKKFIKKGADVNKVGKSSPLYVAISKGYADIVKLLIDEGASIDSSQYSPSTPLIKACDQGHVEIVTLLVDKGADVNANDTNTTPLYKACEKKFRDVAEVLVKKGADVNKVNSNKEKRTPLFIACSQGMLYISKLLIKNGANINKADKDKKTPLYMACLYNHVNIVELLIQSKANLNVTNNHGTSAIKQAIRQGNHRIVKLLRAAGAYESPY